MSIKRKFWLKWKNESNGNKEKKAGKNIYQVKESTKGGVGVQTKCANYDWTMKTIRMVEEKSDPKFLRRNEGWK